MPIYTYTCCENTTEQYSSIADRYQGPACPTCGEQMRFKITPTMVHVPQWSAYKCPQTGQIVTSERQRRNIMREHDLIDANDFKPPKAEAAA